MLDEYYIWKQIFESEEKEQIKNLIRLVIMSDDAREYVSNKIIDSKESKKIYKISINLDKESLEENKADEIARELVNEIIKNFQ